MTKNAQPQKFSTWLAEHRAGALDDELTAAMASVAEAVALLEAKGTLSLKLTVSAKGDVVLVSQEVTAKPPTSKIETMYYVTDGRLSRRDPNQPPMPFDGTERVPANMDTDDTQGDPTP